MAEARALAWNRLGTRLVAGYSNGVVCHWDMTTLQPVRLHTSEAYLLHSLSLSHMKDRTSTSRTECYNRKHRDQAVMAAADMAEAMLQRPQCAVPGRNGWRASTSDIPQGTTRAHRRRR